MLSSKKYLAEKVLEPIARPLSKANPNILTLIGIIPPILFFVFMIYHLYILALVAFVGTVFDLLDGMVARKYNKVTKFGGLLDSTFDRVSDFLIISAFAFAQIVRWEIVAPLLLFSFLISYIRSRGEQASPNISFAVGMIERTERLVMILIALIFFILFPSIYLAGFNVAEVTLVILLILSIYTAFLRLIYSYKKL